MPASNRIRNFAEFTLTTIALSWIAIAPAAAADGLKVHVSARTGLPSLVAAEDGGEIAVALPANVVGLTATDVARAFLEQNASVFGVADVATELAWKKSEIDELGWTNVTFEQFHGGVPVFSGVLKVHIDTTGAVRSANGRFYPIPGKLVLNPALDADAAEKIAVEDFGIVGAVAELRELVIVDPGWYGDASVGPQLAYRIELADPSQMLREAYFVEAQGGEVMDHWSLICDIRDRDVYDGNEGTSLPGTLERSEGQAATGDGDVDRMYDYAGDTYDFFFRGFGRDSIDGAGMTLVCTAHSTYGGCSNARWNGAQTIFCTGLATDDVTAHEFAHGLTQFTAGLIYQNQSGQLNESYSDVFGELIDLYNGNCAFVGAPGGPAWPTHGSGPGGDTPNTLRTACSPHPGYANGKRWRVGEDIAGSTITGAIRDMWDPTCHNHPDRANSAFQTCSAGDAGGVHSGSGVPNHAFAMLTDGKVFNGFTVTGIGPIKAGAVWYRALTVYLTPASDFQDAYYAINQAAADLVGTTPLDPRTGAASASAFTAADAIEVDDALRATEMNTAGACGQGDDVLNSAAAVICAGRTTLFSDGFEGGANGWTVANSGPPTPYNWVQTTGPLPVGRSGKAWYCDNPSFGSCGGAGDESASHTLSSPVIGLPVGANTPFVQFTHYVESEGGWDGGNVKVRVNGGAWQLVPRSAFTFNPYNGRIFTAGQGNTNPLNGQPGFTGAGGVWGTSVVDLSSFASDNDTVQVRFEFGKDGCAGVTGWFVDDFELFNCPDCDSNDQADQRALRFNTASDALSNIGSGSPQSFTITTPPTAGGTVTLTFQAHGDFSAASEYINVDVNGTDVGDIFVADANDCGFTPDRQSLTMTAAAWNAAVGGGNATVNFVATADVNPTIAGACAGSTFVSVFIDYPRTVADCDSDGIPDFCEGGPAAITTQPQPVIACVGSPATFSVVATGAAPLTYQWRRNAVDISGATGSSYTIPSVVSGDAANYSVRVTNGCGNVTSSNAALTVRTPVNITTHPNSQTICTGASVSFTVAATGTATITYQWQRNGSNIAGATSATFTDSNVQAGDAGTYRCNVTNPCGTVTSNEATLTVATSPSISTHPAPQTVCAGGSVTFTVVASGSGLSYQWQRNAVNIGGATSSSLTINPVATGDAGTYRCVVSNSCGSANSNNATLTVNSAPSVTGHPGNQTVCAGSPASFSVTATGTAPLSYQWRKNSVNIGGATASTYNIASAAVGDMGSYDVVVTNSCGSATSNAATLTVNVGPTIGTHPATQTVCAGGSVTFSVSASGTAPLSYQWQRNLVNIGGATNSSFTINPVAAGDAATYRCVVSNACGSVNSNNATLTVNSAAGITGQPGNQTVCAGSPASFSVTANGTAPLSYQWRKNAANIPGATNSTYLIAAAVAGDAGSYDVVVTNACGNVTSSAATLTVNSGPSINTHPSNQTACAGNPASFAVGASGTGPLSYQWQKNSVNIPGATSSTYNIAAVVSGDAGTYRVIVTNACGNTASNAATLSVNAGPGFTQHPTDQSACLGGSATFTVVASGSPAPTLQWQKNLADIPGATGSSLTINPVSAGDAASYRCVAANSCGSTNSNAATLAVSNGPAISQHPTAQDVCPGAPVTFVVTASGTAPLSYQWRKDTTNIPGATSNSYAIPSAASGDAGSYDVVVTNACGNTTSNAAALTVGAGPAISQHPTAQDVCPGAPVTFTVTAGGTAPLSYQWRKDTANIPGATSNSYAIASAASGDAGSYDVVVTNACGNTTSNAAALTVGAGPAISQHPTAQDVCPGAPVTFSVTAGGTAPLSYQWRKNSVDIGGATSSSYGIASAAAGDAGSYDVVVTNACGNTTSNAAALTVGDGPQVTQSPQAATRCPGESITFSVTATGSAPLAYQWRKNTTDIGGATADSYTIASIVAGDAGSYDVRVSNACGSTFSAAATLTVVTCGSPGDMNCDGAVDFFDIDPFLLALFTPAVYDATYPDCDVLNGDLDNTGAVDFFDIDPFLNCLFNQVCN